MNVYKTVISIWALLLAVMASGWISAQEQSLKPGINDSFKDPDVERYIKIFEGESREIFAKRHDIVNALNLKPGMDVADVGAGTGFFSMMMSERVAPGGVIHSVDIAENFIKHIETLSKKEGVRNIEGHVCTERSVELPAESVDLVYICDTYHHFEYPYATLASIHKALRPGGEVVIVDFERIQGASSEWTLNHVRCGKGTVSDEVKDSGFDLVDDIDLGMKGQYVLRFRKRESKS
jgi:predicted methyltransferase